MRAVHLSVMDTEAQPTSWGLESLIDVGELATYLGIPVSTIYDWCPPPRTRLGRILLRQTPEIRRL